MNAAPIPKLAGVCGWPIHHSLSPQLHTYWLQRTGITGAYVPFLVRPDRAVDAFRSLVKTSIVGVNVTLPLKRLAYEAADARTEDAQHLGVANVLYKRGGQLIAHNTDREGFAAPLIERIPPERLRHCTAVVFGAGGAARAVLGALVALGVPEIRLCARREEAARALADDFALPSLYVTDWAARDTVVRGAALIVNATSGGMAGKPPLDVSLAKADAGALAYDLIYTPRMTPFLADAKAHGLETLDGLAMLIGQARPAFRIFYGQNPDPAADPEPLLERLL